MSTPKEGRTPQEPGREFEQGPADLAGLTDYFVQIREEGKKGYNKRIAGAGKSIAEVMAKAEEKQEREFQALLKFLEHVKSKAPENVGQVLDAVGDPEAEELDISNFVDLAERYYKHLELQEGAKRAAQERLRTGDN